jgi:hypothetical protein
LVSASFVIVNLIYLWLAQGRDRHWFGLFAQIGGLSFFITAVVLAIASFLSRVPWSRRYVLACLAYLVWCTIWLFVLSRYLDVNWW